jgi:hypothetical protein
MVTHKTKESGHLAACYPRNLIVADEEPIC